MQLHFIRDHVYPPWYVVIFAFCQFADNMSETFMFNDALAKQNITVRLCFLKKRISLEMIKVVI